MGWTSVGRVGTTGLARVWRPGWPCPVGRILAQHRRGPGDPTFRVVGGGSTQPVHWRGLRTPEGPATLALPAGGDLTEVHAQAWGPGADWALASVPALLGALDDPSGFEPRHPVLAEVHRHHPHWRIGRTGLVMEALLPAILEQKVTGQEAFSSYRALVLRHGVPAPGPGADLRLWVQPDADTLRRIPSWEWLRLHVDPARSRTIVHAATRAGSLERCATLSPVEVERRLTSLPGIGRWTSAEVRCRSLGDADSVSFGDYHVAKDVGWALTGTPFDDDELEAYLEPWRPHRGRVPALLAMAGLRRPRRGPRMALRTHLPSR